ncbi:TetR/AcrR family transcriptional regulator [Nonomuraea sp. NPDC050663]|uniref:TetR/AcrR family transcriptional regulator n=1 Tax=Nonomuraea sp. NPDC050663 TaxID=3364370 RepID=UPI0037B97CF5
MAKVTADDWANAALEAMAEGGPAAVAVEPVAARLGVSKGSFYWHFTNRQALVEAALQRWETSTGEIIGFLEEIPDPAARLRALLELAFSDPRDASVSLRLVGAADDPAVAEVARRVSQRRLGYIAAALEQLGHPPQAARDRALSAYSGYLGLAALLRIGAVTEVPPNAVEEVLREMLT